MSALSSRRVVTTGSLSLALALATPLAAFADPGAPRDAGNGGSAAASASNGQSSSASASKGQSSSASASKGQSSSASASKGQSSSASASKGRSADAGKASSAGAAGKGEGRTTAGASGDATAKRSDKATDAAAGKAAQGASDEGRAAGGDPRGNNGTVKIDGAPVDDGGRGNEPHITCADFELDYYGFDEGDLADVMLTAHAPTKGGALWSRDDALISDDAAGGGQDVDEELTVLISDLAGLTSLTPHPKQGYHIKLTSDTTTAPGGAKQKVFWIEPCATEETAEETATGTVETPAEGEGGGSTETPATGGTVESPATTSGEAVATPVSGGTQEAATGAAEAIAPTFGSGTAVVSGAAVAGTSASTAAGAGAATVSARSATVSARGAAGPSTLPFTGGQELGLVLATGLAALGLGGLAHRLGRKGAHGLR